MNRYDDIIDHEYCGVTSHSRMSLESRAAQFAPFAALTGHGDAISETARPTSGRVELSAYEQDELSRRMGMLLAHIGEHPEAKLTCFRPDPHKEGGSYVTFSCRISKYDEYRRVITTGRDDEISLDNILAVESSLLPDPADEGC